jgi:hypothetical protein
MALVERADGCVVHGTTLHDAIGERQSDAAHHRAGWRSRAATEDDEVRALARATHRPRLQDARDETAPRHGGIEAMTRLTRVRDVFKRHVGVAWKN